MATLQPIEYKRYSYVVFEQKHYMECTACSLPPINAEGEELVIPAAFHTGPRVSGTPVDRAVYDGGASVDRAPGADLPQNRPGRRVERDQLVLMRKLGHRRSVHDPVRDRHRGEVPHTDHAQTRQGFDLRIGGLPEDRAGDRIERRPCATRDGRVPEHAVLRQLVWDVVMVRDRHVNAIAVERCAPLHAALITAGTNEGVPDERAGLRVEERVDTALRPDPDDVAPVSPDPQPHDVHP